MSKKFPYLIGLARTSNFSPTSKKEGIRIIAGISIDFLSSFDFREISQQWSKKYIKKVNRGV
jgi:hypothetical protein